MNASKTKYSENIQKLTFMHRDTFHASEIRRLLRQSSELELSHDVIQKLKWFLFAAEHDGNVSLTCRHFGVSRSTYLRWAKRFDVRDLRTLEECSRSPHTVREPETDPQVIALITQIRTAQPLISKEAIAALLQSTHNIILSSSTVGRVISRHGLFFADTTSHRRKREQFLATATPTTPVAIHETLPAIGESESGLSYQPSPHPAS